MKLSVTLPAPEGFSPDHLLTLAGAPVTVRDDTRVREGQVTSAELFQADHEPRPRLRLEAEVYEPITPEAKSWPTP